MTPAHTDSPLRRSEVGIFRDSVSGPNVAINDDDEERRQARRRTLMQDRSSEVGSPSTFEENETLKKCLEIYNGNKLSRDNAWSVSLIDTLSTLLDRHHKSLNNFKVAGSSLEASSKVYGLRVDSIHTDVLRMSAGLNAQKFSEKQSRGGDDDEDDVAVADGDPNNSHPEGAAASSAKAPPPKKPKRQRKAVSTITKNKETLNARLDTVPLQDPVFGKLNSIVGSINSSTRLMNNILLTTDSELRLRTNFSFWDASELPECDFTEEVSYDESEMESAPCDRLFKVERYEDLQLRPTHGGYVISDTAEVIADDTEKRRLSVTSNNSSCGADGAEGGFMDNFNPDAEMSMAFDINAECEPLPPSGAETAAPILDVDYGELEELTTDERVAINNCRGLRKAPVLIEDLRPVDSNSKLEYSYRPLDKISQFWAGPSHWKFKRPRMRGSTIHGQQVLGASDRQNGRTVNQRSRRVAANLAKQRTKLNFGEYHDDLFIKLDDKFKARKANVQKKWDYRKLKLPTDLQIDPMIFFKYSYAPGLSAAKSELQDSAMPPGNDDTDDEQPMGFGESGHFGDNDEVLGPGNHMDISSMVGGNTMLNGPEELGGDDLGAGADDMNECNNTVLEIGTHFDGAPTQVTKIIVPFAKRAKVIDMKNLKRCCSQLLRKQMKRTVEEGQQLPSHPLIAGENYGEGIASFKEIYDSLPDLLTQKMAESLSPSVAFYSVLHLANDLNLRLIQENDLEDFKIRQVML